MVFVIRLVLQMVLWDTHSIISEIDWRPFSQPTDTYFQIYQILSNEFYLLHVFFPLILYINMLQNLSFSCYVKVVKR